MSDAELSRVRWRCRRGMRELDQLFDRYLKHAWAQQSDADRTVFLRLLETEDDTLWRWVMGYEACDDAEISELLERMQKLPY